jgi:hypothetical protein
MMESSNIGARRKSRLVGAARQRTFPDQMMGFMAPV